MCHRARFFALVTFVKNPEKSLPFQPFFLFVYALCISCISLGGDIAIID